MSDPSLFRLRVRYVKQGRLALLSHLELVHALERIIRRSGLPFAVSRGFSPHMRIAFGSALPVGVGGTGEIFDLLLSTYVAPAKALGRLRAASPDDLMPYDAQYIDHSAKAASVAFSRSTYECALEYAPAGFAFAETVTMRKKDKVKELATADFLCGGPVIDGCTVTFTLRASNAGSMRPDVLLAQSLEAASSDGEANAPRILSITRTDQRP